MDEQTVTGPEQAVSGWRQAYRTVSAASLSGAGARHTGTAGDTGSRIRDEAGPSGVADGSTSALVGVMLMLDLGDSQTALHHLAVCRRGRASSQGTRS